MLQGAASGHHHAQCTAVQKKNTKVDSKFTISYFRFLSEDCSHLNFRFLALSLNLIHILSLKKKAYLYEITQV